MRKLATVTAAAVLLLPLTAGSCGVRPVPWRPCVEAGGEPCDDDPHRGQSTKTPVKLFTPKRR